MHGKMGGGHVFFPSQILRSSSMHSKKCNISIRNQVNPMQNLAEATGTICLVKDAKCSVLSGTKGGCNKKAAFDGGCYVWGCVL